MADNITEKVVVGFAELFGDLYLLAKEHYGFTGRLNRDGGIPKIKVHLITGEDTKWVFTARHPDTTHEFFGMLKKYNCVRDNVFIDRESIISAYEMEERDKKRVSLLEEEYAILNRMESQSDAMTKHSNRMLLLTYVILAAMGLQIIIALCK